jgi:hypothetical protein
MENNTKKIIAVETMDKRQVGKKSANMERACFNKALGDLKNRGVDVGQVVTDGHRGIAAEMGK